jgi:hypothetical protein
MEQYALQTVFEHLYYPGKRRLPRLLLCRLACPLGYIVYMYSILEMRREIVDGVLRPCVIQLSWAVHTTYTRHKT